MAEVAEDKNEDLKRELKSRHVNMFAIAGSIGTGLIIGTGKALAAGGPGSLLVSYLILGSAVYFVMTALGEMAAFSPMTKGFSGYATRYVDPALGQVAPSNVTSRESNRAPTASQPVGTISSSTLFCLLTT